MVWGCANSYWIQLLSPALRDGQLRGLFQIAVVEHGRVGSSCAGRHLRMQRFNRDIIGRPAVCDHGSVGVELGWRRSARGRGESITNADVLKSSGVGRRMRQRACERLAALDQGLAPHILLHSLRRRHPRTTGLAPSWRTCNRLFHSQLIGERGRILETRPSTPASCRPGDGPPPGAWPGRHRSSGIQPAARDASTPGPA